MVSKQMLYKLARKAAAGAQSLPVVGAVFTAWHTERRRRQWNRRWRKDGFDPSWQADGLADPVRRAVDDGWFTPGMRVLDIGCGTGRVAAWLVEQGLAATGIDFSPPAIARAQRHWCEIPGLEFQVVDVCARGRLTAQFDALLDRGCLHGLGSFALQSVYARNVASWAKPGCHFLLLMHHLKTSAEVRAEQVRTLLSPEFELVGSQPATMAHGTDQRSIEGSVFRLVRR